MAKKVDRGEQTVQYERGHGTNVGSVIKKALKARGYTYEMLSKALGYNGTSGTSMLLNGKRRIRVDTMLAALDAMGFEVVVRDRNRSNKENQWVLELADSEDVED